MPRVEASYWCDARYGSQPPEDRRATLFIQQSPGGFSETIEAEAICDGASHIFVRRVRLDGSEIDKRVPLIVHFSVLYAGGKDTFRLTDDGATTIMADIEIGQIRLNDRGRFVVGLSYQCPTGYSVPTRYGSYDGYMELYQARSGDTIWDDFDTLASDIICDDTRTPS